MRRRSGNGKKSAQWLYLLWNFPYLGVCKIGIGGDLGKRVRGVDRTSKGKDFTLFAVKVLFAYQTEQFMHSLFSMFRVRFNGSGKTERFSSLVIIPSICIMLAALALTWIFYACLLLGVGWLILELSNL
jgi:hypothetical protein